MQTRSCHSSSCSPDPAHGEPGFAPAVLSHVHFGWGFEPPALSLMESLLARHDFFHPKRKPK